MNVFYSPMSTETANFTAYARLDVAMIIWLHKELTSSITFTLMLHLVTSNSTTSALPAKCRGVL